MARNIRIRDRNNIPETIRNLERLKRVQAKVGYMSGGELQMIAGVHEFGARIEVTPQMRGYLASQGLRLKKDTRYIVIPERSFIRAGADEAEEDVWEKAEELLPLVLQNNIDPQLFFQMLGEELKGKIQDFADDLRDPENHPFTIEKKGSSNPLVDSHHMINSMEVVVE